MRTFIEICADIEELAGQIYRELARRSVGNERLQEILSRMALDEEDHARQLRLALKVSATERFSGVNEKVGDPFALRIRARELLRQAGEQDVDETDVLAIAIELEMDFSKIHSGYSLVFKDQAVKKMFAALARADDQHVADLKSYLRDYSQRKPGVPPQ